MENDAYDVDMQTKTAVREVNLLAMKVRERNLEVS